MLGNLFTRSSHGLPTSSVKHYGLLQKETFFGASCDIAYGARRRGTHLSAWPYSPGLSLRPPATSSNAELFMELQRGGTAAYWLEISFAVKDLGVLVGKKLNMSQPLWQ